MFASSPEATTHLNVRFDKDVVFNLRTETYITQLCDRDGMFKDDGAKCRKQGTA